MGRVNFKETAVLPQGPNNALIPISGIAYVPYIVNPDGTEGAQSAAFADRSGPDVAPTLVTDSSGSISYWLEGGDYNIHVSDQQSPPRITAYVMGFTAPVIVTAAPPSTTFSGDTKFSLQTADHGLNTDGSYEWILMESDVDGGGRKLNAVLYSALWQLVGSPTPDGAGNFRLPNVSGRSLMAAGAATGLTVRNLFDSLGAEGHSHTAELHVPALSVPALSVPALAIPSLGVNAHHHPLSSAGGALAWFVNGTLGGNPVLDIYSSPTGRAISYSGGHQNGLGNWAGSPNGTFDGLPISGGSTALEGNTDDVASSTIANSTGTGNTGTGNTGTGTTSGSTDSANGIGPSLVMNLFMKS